LARGAAGGPVAEQPAGRDAGIEDDAFQRKAVGEPLPRFPGPHRGEAEPERAGHFFLGEAVVEPPAFQDPGEIRPQPAGRVHAPFLAPNAGRGKHFLARHRPTAFPEPCATRSLRPKGCWTET